MSNYRVEVKVKGRYDVYAEDVPMAAGLAGENLKEDLEAIARGELNITDVFDIFVYENNP